MDSIQVACEELEKGRIVVLNEDLNENISYFVGILDHIRTDHVNFMINNGKGLVYACVSENVAENLSLPIMIEREDNNKLFTNSVDHKSVTTGISVPERTETLKALNRNKSKKGDFLQPGHVFPLIYSKNGLLNSRNIADAASDITRMVRDQASNSFVCEILNENGDIVSSEELNLICNRHNLLSIKSSDIIKHKADEVICKLEGTINPIPYVNKSRGFPNYNLIVCNEVPELEMGVYGIELFYESKVYRGLMHVNESNLYYKKSKKLFDICLLDPIKTIENEIIEVNVKFFLRKLQFFSSSSIDDLVVRYENDFYHALNLFRIMKE